LRGRKPSENKKVNLTLSIDSKIFQEIQKKANKKDISINAFTNEILTDFVTFFQHYKALKGVGIPARIFKEMIEGWDEKQMYRWVSMANNEIWPSLMLRYNIPTNIENFADYSFGNVACKAGLFSNFSQHVDEKGFLCLVFEHEFGTKWSQVISDVFSESLSNLFKVETERKILSDTVLIKIMEKNLTKLNIQL
jgi:hypothetical protein